MHSLVADSGFSGRTDEIHHARREELHHHIFGRIQEECSQSGTLRIKGVILKNSSYFYSSTIFITGSMAPSISFQTVCGDSDRPFLQQFRLVHAAHRTTHFYESDPEV